jgi:4-hydroxy-tetrahydrodipicolinate synthase
MSKPTAKTWKNRDSIDAGLPIPRRLTLTKEALSGVFAAAVTPLKADYSPDLGAIPAFLAFLAGRGCHGALLLGTTGEGPSFSSAERAAIWQAALEVQAKYPEFILFAGTGTPSLSETISLTKLAFDLGFSGVVTLPPYYYRAATDDGLFAWFQQLLTSAVPADGLLLGYHFPAVAGIGFSLSLVRRLKDAFPGKFAGLKDSSHDRQFARALGEEFGRDLAVFSGTDSDLSWALENHAAGCITAAANVISPGLRRVYEAYANRSEGSAAQSEVSAQRHILERYMPFPPTLKALLARLYRQPRWSVRPPLLELPQLAEEELVRELSEVAPGSPATQA